MALKSVMVSSGNDTWATPDNVYSWLNKEFNFTLDPCCTKETAKCKKFFTLDDDGLKQSWANEVVFMNPPYSTIKPWIYKAYSESNNSIVVCLIPANTSNATWHDIIFPYADQIRFIRGRIKFIGAKDSAPFGSAIVIFGKKYKEKIVWYNKSITRSDFYIENNL